jgi:hypothetical protein
MFGARGGHVFGRRVMHPVGTFGPNTRKDNARKA